MTNADITPTGRLADDGRTLELLRTFRAPIDDVWASVTESERLARWYGTWEGDPDEGFVMLRMNAEPGDVPPTRYDITECRPPHVLAVDAVDDYGHWKLRVELSEDDGVTTLVLRQHDVDLDVVHDIGPGWEWYLDRLGAIVRGATAPTLADFELTYHELGDRYRRMVERFR